MTEKEFIYSMKVIDRFEKEQEIFQESIDKISNGNTIITLGDNLLFNYIGMLTKHFEGAIKDDWIGWWVYKHKRKKDRIAVIDGKRTLLDTPKKLYNFLINLKTEEI